MSEWRFPLYISGVCVLSAVEPRVLLQVPESIVFVLFPIFLWLGLVWSCFVFCHLCSGTHRRNRNLSFGTPLFRGHKMWSRKNVHIIFVSVNSIEGTPLFRGLKMWSRKNVHIIFVSVNSIEGTHLFRGHKMWSRKNVHIIFVSVNSIEGTPLFRGHKMWSRKNVHIIFVSVNSIEGTHLFRGHKMWSRKKCSHNLCIR